MREVVPDVGKERRGAVGTEPRNWHETILEHARFKTGLGEDEWNQLAGEVCQIIREHDRQPWKEDKPAPEVRLAVRVLAKCKGAFKVLHWLADRVLWTAGTLAAVLGTIKAIAILQLLVSGSSIVWLDGLGQWMVGSLLVGTVAWSVARFAAKTERRIEAANICDVCGHRRAWLVLTDPKICAHCTQEQLRLSIRDGNSPSFLESLFFRAAPKRIIERETGIELKPFNPQGFRYYPIYTETDVPKKEGQKRLARVKEREEDLPFIEGFYLLSKKLDPVVAVKVRIGEIVSWFEIYRWFEFFTGIE
ncbi:MAG: hypothetical protein ACE5JP_10030 [Candidatus Bipolaricaulia bacterium]